ncbi:restriction endonuclease subunit S [Fusobacterium necrophorum]|uniref:restriction endonuclease subunit S n=1 Tax=Fusobacterium necrophorum TaxID=859 RepID=UPI003FA02B0F
MAEWKTVRLGTIVSTNQSTYSPKEDWQFVNYLDTGNITMNRVDEIQYINTSTDKLPSRARRKVKLNSIIYSTVRPNQLHYGIIKEQPDNFLVSTGFAVIDVDFEKAVPDYIYYVLTQKEVTEHLQAIAEQSVSAYPSIKPSDIENLELLLPDRKTQEKIVAILSSIDKKIKQNNEINNNLEQQVSILYQSWFEDFERTDGICPEDWNYQELSTIADIASGKRPPVKSEVCNQETPVAIVGAASVMGFTSEANHIDKILVTGRVGTHGIIQRFNTPCWASDNTLVITSPYYEFTNQILHRIDYSSMNRGSTQPLITQGDIKKVVVLVPDEETLAKFEEFASSLMAKWEANKIENVKLALLRDALLPKLMSGELDVSDIDL